MDFLRYSGGVCAALLALSAACFSPNEMLSSEAESETQEAGTSSSSASAGVTGGSSTAGGSDDTSSDPTGDAGDTSGTSATSESTTRAETTTSGESVGEEASGTSSSAGLPCVDECVPAAPDGWVGPVVQSAEPGMEAMTGCGDEFPNSVADGFSSVSGAQADCGCSCGDPAGGACEDPLTIHIYDQDSNGNACNNLTQTITTTQTPYGADTNGSGINVVIDPPEVVSDPVCVGSLSETIPEIQHGDAVELCGGVFSGGECGAEEICVPSLSSAFVAAYCVYSEGDVACPIGSEYSQRTVYYAGESDTRDCSACSCGDAQNVDCAGVVTFSAVYQVSGGGFQFDPGENELANGTCRVVNPNFTSTGGVTYGLEYEPADPTSSGCSPIGGSPVGAASGTEPFTVCCTP